MPRRLLVARVGGGALGVSRSAPQVGQAPSGVIADGAQYFSQSSHHGISSARFLTRSLIGVEPKPNASRIDRSR